MSWNHYLPQMVSVTQKESSTPFLFRRDAGASPALLSLGLVVGISSSPHGQTEMQGEEVRVMPVSRADRQFPGQGVATTQKKGLRRPRNDDRKACHARSKTGGGSDAEQQ